MSTINLSYLCPNCGREIKITKDDKVKSGNLMLCPYPDCEKNLFPHIEDADRVLLDFNKIKEISHGK